MDKQEPLTLIETAISQLRTNFLNAIEECTNQMAKEKDVALYEGLNPMAIDNEVRRRMHNFNRMLRELYVGREGNHSEE